MPKKEEDIYNISWINPELEDKLYEIQSLLRLVLNEQDFTKESIKKGDAKFVKERKLTLASKIANLVNGIQDVNQLAINNPIIKSTNDFDYGKEKDCQKCTMEKKLDKNETVIEKDGLVSYQDLIGTGMSQHMEIKNKTDDNQSSNSKATVKMNEKNMIKIDLSKARRMKDLSSAGSKDRNKNHSFEKEQKKRRSIQSVAFNEVLKNEVYQEVKHDAFETLIKLDTSDMLDDWAFSHSFKDILHDFSTFSNTMSYFSLYNVYEIEDLINIGVSEKEKLNVFMHKSEALIDKIHEQNDMTIKKYSKLKIQEEKTDKFIERASITFRAIKRSEVCSCCKNKVHQFTPGKENFQQRLDAIKKFHLKGMNEKINKLEIGKKDISTKYSKTLNKLNKSSDSQIQDAGKESRIPLYKFGNFMKINQTNLRLDNNPQKMPDTISQTNNTLSGGLEMYNKSYEKDKTCHFCIENLPVRYLNNNNLSKTQDLSQINEVQNNKLHNSHTKSQSNEVFNNNDYKNNIAMETNKECMNSFYGDHECENRNKVFYNVFNTTNFYTNDHEYKQDNYDSKKKLSPRSYHLKKVAAEFPIQNRISTAEVVNLTDRIKRPYSSYKPQKNDAPPTIITTNDVNYTTLAFPRQEDIIPQKKSSDIQDKINLVMKQNRKNKRIETMSLNSKKNTELPIKGFDTLNVHYDKNQHYNVLHETGAFSTEIPRRNSSKQRNISINNRSIIVPDSFDNRTDRVRVRSSYEKKFVNKKNETFDTETENLNRKESKKAVMQQYINSLNLYYNSNAKNTKKNLNATDRDINYNKKEKKEQPINLSQNSSASRKSKVKKNPNAYYKLFDKVDFKETLIGNITKNDKFDKKSKDSTKPLSYGLVDVREKMPFMTAATFSKNRTYIKERSDLKH